MPHLRAPSTDLEMLRMCVMSVIRSAVSRQPLYRAQYSDPAVSFVKIRQPWNSASTLHPDVRCFSSVGDGSRSEKTERLPTHIFQRIRDSVTSQYLPLSLLATMALGYVWPQPGVLLADANFAKYCTISVFICSGLLLERREATKALTARGSLAFGLASILLLTPLAAPLIMLLPLQPSELALGLAVFMLAPTTLSTGVTLVQAARANVAMALLLTLISNFLSVFTIPVTLPYLIGKMTGGSIVLSPLYLLKNLTATVLAPTLVAYGIKTTIKGGENWVRQRRKIVSNIGTTSLMMIPWMQISKASMSGVAVDPLSLAVGVSAGVAMHLLFLSANHLMSGFLRLGGDVASEQAVALRRAVVLLSSQKSVTIAVAVLAQLSTYLSPEAVGMACMPCVLVHLAQTVVDSFIASRWASAHKPRTA